MRLRILVKPKSKYNLVEDLRPHITDEIGYDFIIKVSAPAIEGKANEAVRILIADYFHIPKSRVKLVMGVKSRIKVFEIYGI